MVEIVLSPRLRELKESLKKRKCSKVVAKRFTTQYGVWIVLASYIDEKVMLRLQILNKWFYSVCIGRVQKSIKIPTPAYLAGLESPF